METQATAEESQRPHPLLWAIVDFREDLDRLIEEQKALILNRAGDPAVGEQPPVVVAAAAPPSPLSTTATTTTKGSDPPARTFTTPVTRSRPRESPQPQPQPQPAPVAEPVAVEPAHPAKPEDARQRLDALAAKLLDRRNKNTAAEPAARAVEK